MDKNIIIYSTPTCPYCKMVKQYLDGNKIEYTDYDVSENKEKAAEMTKKSEQMGVPVIDIDGKIIVGFRKDIIQKELGI